MGSTQSRQWTGFMAASALLASFLTPQIASAQTVQHIPNGDFESIDSTWVATSWTMSKTVWASDSANHTEKGKYSQRIDQWNSDTTLSQHISVDPGIYTVSLYVWANEKVKLGTLNANHSTAEIISNGATQIDSTKTWDKIAVSGVKVEDGKLDIAIQLDKVTSTSLEGYIDDVDLEKTGDIPHYPSQASDGKIIDGNLQQTASWTLAPGVKVTSSPQPATVSGAGELSQAVKNLESGDYEAHFTTHLTQGTARAFTRTFDGQEDHSALISTSHQEQTIVVPVTVHDGWVCVGFSLNDAVLTVREVSLIKVDPNTDEFITNAGFENGMTGWESTGTLINSGYAHSSHALQLSPDEKTGRASLSQDLGRVENGYYTLDMWVQNNSAWNSAVLSASTGENISPAKTAIPRTDFLFNKPGDWKKVTLRGIHVTENKLRVGVLAQANDTSSRLIVDAFHLVKDDQPYEFLIGGDVSTVTYTEDLAGVYKDENGVARDPFQYLAENGWNIVRIRIFNSPGSGRGNGEYYVPEGYVDLNDALVQARRAKAVGLKIQLSFHYSDYWTNPGAQIIPQAWQSLIKGKNREEATEILEHQIEEFTAHALEKMKAQGTTPEYVSLGNETRSGMLFPYGSTSDWQTLARFYNAGARAVRRIAPDSHVMIHLDDGGNTDRYRTYFSQAEKYHVDYDIIGTSFYPSWTKKNADDFVSFAADIAQRFGKPIFIMETGFNWKGTNGLGHEGQLTSNGPYGQTKNSTPQLQKDFMIDLFNAMKTVPQGMVIGDLYWDPVLLYAGGRTGWAYSQADGSVQENVVDNTTLFDFDGRALPVMQAYRDTSLGSGTGMVAGKVIDSDGNPVGGAEITAGHHSTQSVANGDFLLTGLKPGETNIKAHDNELGSSQPFTTTIKPGETEHLSKPLLINASQKLVVLSGEVKNEKGQAVRDAGMKLVNTSNRIVATTSSHQDGSYSFAPVKPGSYTVNVSSPGLITYESKVDIFDHGNSTLQRDVVLQQNVGTLTGVVNNAINQPQPGVTIQLSNAKGTVATLHTDENGYF